MAVELKPCPVNCSTVGQVVPYVMGDLKAGHSLLHYVQCGCGWRGPMGRDPNEAITAWNTRASDSKFGVPCDMGFLHDPEHPRVKDYTGGRRITGQYVSSEGERLGNGDTPDSESADGQVGEPRLESRDADQASDAPGTGPATPAPCRHCGHFEWCDDPDICKESPVACGNYASLNESEGAT